MLLNCGVEELLRVPWTARRSNQSILKGISPEYSLEGLMLKLKVQYYGHQMGRTDSLEKTRCWEGLRAGGEGDDRGWDSWVASPTEWTQVWASSGAGDGQGGLACCSPWVAESDRAEKLNWTEVRPPGQGPLPSTLLPLGSSPPAPDPACLPRALPPQPQPGLGSPE